MEYGVVGPGQGADTFRPALRSYAVVDSQLRTYWALIAVPKCFVGCACRDIWHFTFGKHVARRTHINGFVLHAVDSSQ